MSRVTKFCLAKFGTQIPEGNAYSTREKIIIETLTKKVNTLSEYLESIEIRKAAAELRSIWAIGNEYLQEAAPWGHFKENPERAACIIRFSFNLIALYANISRPFIPDTCGKIDEALNLKNNTSWPNSLPNFLNSNLTDHEFEVPENLFQKLSDERTAELKLCFSGKES